jgi:polyhydroxyalkanoate synthesis repressor PhaR
MASDVRTIKKYPNRRLYDTANSGYITLAYVKQMVLDPIEWRVREAQSGDDLTRQILLQINLDEEAGGMPMFSADMLSQMIRFYGTAQQTIIGQYIEQNVQAFLAIQKKLQDQAKQVYGDKMMLTPELWKQFMQMQAPAMQGMLGNYLEQSAKLFIDMQQRMQDQTRGMFSAFPFPTFGTPPPGAPDDESKRWAARSASVRRASGADFAAPRRNMARRPRGLLRRGAGA